MTPHYTRGKPDFFWVRAGGGGKRAEKYLEPLNYCLFSSLPLLTSTDEVCTEKLKKNYIDNDWFCVLCLSHLFIAFFVKYLFIDVDPD